METSTGFVETYRLRGYIKWNSCSRNQYLRYYVSLLFTSFAEQAMVGSLCKMLIRSIAYDRMLYSGEEKIKTFRAQQ